MMNTKEKLPTLDAIKAQAKRLRLALADAGNPVSHSKSLELIAHQFGHKDWNTIHAAIGNRPQARPLNIGTTVQGRYLGQAFSGEIIGVKALQGSSRFRLTLDLPVPIDVVTFDSFSSYRRRINCVVDERGVSTEKTSNGEPQMVLDLGR